MVSLHRRCHGISGEHTGTKCTRAQLLGRGVPALLAGGTALGWLAGSAAAEPLPSGDLAYARLLVGAELLAADFYTQAIAAAAAGPAVTKYLKRAYANEQEHYQSVAGILRGAGAVPAVAADIDFAYPAGTFGSERSILAAAHELESTLLGAYLGAVGGLQTASLKQGLAEIAACEAQHVSYFTAAFGGRAFALSFPPALTIDQASDAMDAFTA
jgi:hypothetical protein